MGKSIQHGRLTFIISGETNVQERENPESAFSLVLPILKKADAVFGHMEGLLFPPSTDPDSPDLPFKPGWRHSDPPMVSAFKHAGYLAVSCASNVAYGREAICSTVDTLREAGIAFSGIGKNLEEARSPAIVEKNGIHFGLLGYGSVFWPNVMRATPGQPGMSALAAKTLYQPHRRTMEMPGVPPVITTEPLEEDLEVMKQSVKELRSKVDIVIFSCHWGISSSPIVQQYQQAYGRAAIEAGADIVFGHHPHVLQPVEIWKGKPIFYSLGNFAFDWFKMRGRNQDGVLLRCTMEHKKIVSYELLPASRNQENTIEPLSLKSEKGAEIIERLKELSGPYGTEISNTPEDWARLSL